LYQYLWRLQLGCAHNLSVSAFYNLVKQHYQPVFVLLEGTGCYDEIPSPGNKNTTIKLFKNAIAMAQHFCCKENCIQHVQYLLKQKNVSPLCGVAAKLCNAVGALQ
jgi:hypothetical protein